MQPMKNHTTDWHVLYVRSKTERKVAKGLQELGYEVRLPLQKQLRQWSDRKKWIDSVLFNNYVFVETDQKRKNQVFEVGNIIRYVHIGGEMATLTQPEIAFVNVLCSDKNIIEDEKPRIFEGQTIQIIHGQLAGQLGIVCTILKDDIVRIEIPGLGCLACIEMPTSNICFR
jgi:transcription antitermination factor NusG